MPQQNKFIPLKLIYVARTPQERAAGLTMLKGKLGNDQAMLFEFPSVSDSTFWNKGVNYPIDLGFFNKKRELIFTTSLQANQTNPVFCLTGHYNYVLETPYQWFLKNKIPNGIPLDNLIQGA